MRKHTRSGRQNSSTSTTVSTSSCPSLYTRYIGKSFLRSADFPSRGGLGQPGSVTSSRGHGLGFLSEMPFHKVLRVNQYISSRLPAVVGSAKTSTHTVLHVYTTGRKNTTTCIFSSFTRLTQKPPAVPFTEDHEVKGQIFRQYGEIGLRISSTLP